jgi:hypothetical protein
MHHLENRRFGRLVAIKISGKDGARNKWLCKCDCGNETHVRSTHLTNLCTLSCGCLAKEMVRERNTTHGGSYTPEFSVWKGIKYRCYDKTCKSFSDYGARGIKMSEAWMDFAQFLKDMGKRPTPNHTIERIENDKGYCAENCKWITKSEQAWNKRNNRMIEYKGHRKCVAQWAFEHGLRIGTVHQRLQYGWDEIRAITTPVMNK